MTSLLPAARRGGSTQLVRAAAAEIEAVKAHAAVVAAEVVAVSYVVEAGMTAIASLSHTEEALAQQAPLAVTRLQLLGDVGTARIASIVRSM